MESISAFLGALKVGRVQVHENMCIFPLLAPDAGPPGYLTLDEAVSRGAVRLTEVDEGGSVPELKLVNLSTEKILVVDGEELVGAKQNRVVNATFLLPPQGEVVLPVSCVEQGRWAWRSRDFTPGDKLLPRKIRSKHLDMVAASLSMGMGFHSDQTMIWDEVDELIREACAEAPSQAMSDVYDQMSGGLDGYLKAFRPVDCQLGAIFCLDGMEAGLEAFGHQATFSTMFAKIVKSYALDAALSSKGKEQLKRPSSVKVRGFLEKLGKGRTERFPSLGLGESVRIHGRGVSGASLVEEGRVIHLVAFPEEKGPGSGAGSPMERYSSRRRRLVL